MKLRRITIEVTGKVFWSEAEENLVRLTDWLCESLLNIHLSTLPKETSE